MQFKKIVVLVSISLTITISSPAVCAERMVSEAAVCAAQVGLSGAKLVASNISIPVPVFGGRVSLLQLGKVGLGLKLTQTLWQMRRNPAQRKSYMGTLTTFGLFAAGWWLLSCNTEQIVERIDKLQNALDLMKQNMNSRLDGIAEAQQQHGEQLAGIGNQLAGHGQQLSAIKTAQDALAEQQGDFKRQAADHHQKATDDIRRVGSQVAGLADKLNTSDENHQKAIKDATAANTLQHDATRGMIWMLGTQMLRNQDRIIANQEAQFQQSREHITFTMKCMQMFAAAKSAHKHLNALQVTPHHA